MPNITFRALYCLHASHWQLEANCGLRASQWRRPILLRPTQVRSGSDGHQGRLVQVHGGRRNTSSHDVTGSICTRSRNPERGLRDVIRGLDEWRASEDPRRHCPAGLLLRVGVRNVSVRVQELRPDLSGYKRRTERYLLCLLS